VECRTHELVDGRSCERCKHFLNAVPAPDGRSVLVRCVVFENDSVDVLMTREEDLVSVSAEDGAEAAAARMLDQNVQQLVVTSGDLAVGLVEAPEIAKGSGLVGSHVSRRFPVVPRTMTLGAAARAFRAGDLDVVGVLDGDELVGLITRGDLRRAGVPGL
jgi:CBS domain-containing protein